MTRGGERECMWRRIGAGLHGTQGGPAAPQDSWAAVLRRVRQATFNQLHEARPGKRFLSFSSSCFSSAGDIVKPVFFSYSPLLVATSALNSAPGGEFLASFGSLVPSGR